MALGVPGGAPLNLSTPTVLVGPEGGWSDSELAAIPSSRHIGLGPNVLRAETAALAAGLLLVALRTGLVLPVGPATGAPAGPATAINRRLSSPPALCLHPAER